MNHEGNTTSGSNGIATIRETKSVPYTAYRDEVVVTQARLAGKIEAIKEVRNAGKITENDNDGNGTYTSLLGLAESKQIVDTLWDRGYRFVKIED